MATVLFQGKQARRAQKNTITVSGTPAAGNVATVTINGKSVTYTVVSGDTTSTIASGLADLLRATDNGEFRLIDWTVSGAVITATAAVAGEPFTATGSGTLTVASTGGGATTLTAASVDTNQSPNDLNDTANYSSGALPIGGDTLVFESLAEGGYWNLDALSALTLNIIFRSTFAPTDRTCWIGNPTFHPTLNFREFRGTELQVTGATTLTIELPAGAPAECYRINGGTGASTVKIFGAGDSQLFSEAVQWRGTHATLNAIEVYGASICIQPQHFSASGTAVVQTIKAIDSVVRLETGVTVNTSVDLRNSVFDSRVTVPTHIQDGQSEATYRDSAACGTAMKIDEGLVRWNASGNISGTLAVGSDATVDFSGAKSTITVGSGTGTVVLQEGARYLDPEKRTIASLGADTLLLDRTSIDKVTLDFGTNIYIDIANGP